MDYDHTFVLGGFSRSGTSLPIDLAAGTAVTAINSTRSMITRKRTYIARCQSFNICVWKKRERKGGSKQDGEGVGEGERWQRGEKGVNEGEKERRIEDGYRIRH